LTIKYLRRESFSFYPTLLSKIAITADQKALRIASLSESRLIRAYSAPDSSIPSGLVGWWS